MAITGYAGFVPQFKSESKFSKSYTKITKFFIKFRDTFTSNRLEANKHNLASTGFNYKTHDFIDNSKQAKNHKYGSSNIIKNHPCCDVFKNKQA